MYQGRSRRIILLGLAIYTVLTFYFLFVGFHRASSVQEQGLRYSFNPEGIPLHFPAGRDFGIWLFELGNYAAFIPFGIIIPLLYRCSFIRFICWFLVSITVIEIIQMISRLGAFDIDDILINTIGAAVGYGAQRMVTRQRESVKGMLRIALLAAGMSIGFIAAVGGINHYLEQGGGDIVVLNELPLKEGSVLWDNNLTGFTAAETKVQPQINLYSRKNTGTHSFSYDLQGNYAKMTGYAAIPADADNVPVNGRSEITFVADGEEIYSLSLEGEQPPESFELPLRGVNELNITLNGDHLNPAATIVMWDVTLTEVNTGQRIINSIRSIF
ncbi:VanZ family protein [Paenibacillus sp. sgz500958]|uniref:VanZ family protein n=1 Tax=Paenibacillus sp. sgz500958 TaxID=3242475 RepID=UPI0036D326FB